MLRRLLLPCLLAAPTAVAAQSLLDGAYGCSIGSSYLGEIVIKDSKYRGPALDGGFEGPSHRFRVDGPTITWEGPLGGISAAGTIVSTVLKGGGDGVLDGFDIVIQMAESGNFQTVTCGGPG